MTIFLLLLVCQFSTQYKDFLNSPQSDSIFAGLTRGDFSISDFADDPIVLWFWRTSSEDPQADSFLKRITLRKNYFLSAVLRWEAEESDDDETILQKLRLATHFDSSSIENALAYAVLAVEHRDINHLTTAMSIPFSSDFRNRVFIITNVVLLCFLIMTMCGVIYVLVKTVYYLPVLSHRIDPQRHNKIKGMIPFLLLLIPILAFRNLYIITLCYSFLLILVLNSKEKNWLRFYIIVFLMFFIVQIPLSRFIMFLNHHTRSYKLYEMVNYDSNYTIEAKNNKEKELLAYALKQQGRLEEALSMYENLYDKNYRKVAIVNNLANIYFHYERLARAEALYHKAILAEDRGEPYFNLGLLKLKQIEYLESSKYMIAAQERNFSSFLNEPVDIQPTHDDLYEITAAEKSKNSSVIKNLYFLPFLIILILTFLPIRLSPPFYCTTCGRALCEKCLKKIETEIICKECFEKFKSTKTGEMEESLRGAVTQSRKRLRKFTTYLINTVVPGAGMIYQGKTLAGLIVVFFVMIGYVPILFSRFFIKPAGWTSFSLNSIFIGIAVIIAAFAYAYSFSLIRRRYAS